MGAFSGMVVANTFPPNRREGGRKEGFGDIQGAYCTTDYYYYYYYNYNYYYDHLSPFGPRSKWAAMAYFSHTCSTTTTTMMILMMMMNPNVITPTVIQTKHTLLLIIITSSTSSSHPFTPYLRGDERGVNHHHIKLAP